MGTYKTNWQLTETVMPEDMNRIEENTKELSTDLINFKESSRKSFEARDKEISEKAQKSDTLLKVPVPENRDCNSFKTPNAFCTYDTGIGDFKNTPEGILNQGTARVFMIMNKAFSGTRIQQEFINLYPQNRVTRYIRNFNEEGWGNWYKIYDEANKPTANDIGASPSNHNHDSTYITKAAIRLERADLNTITTGGFYAIIANATRNLPENSDGYLLVMPWNSGYWCSQIFIEDLTGRMYTRTNTVTSGGIKWSPWAKVYTSDSKPTLNDICGKDFFTGKDGNNSGIAVVSNDGVMEVGKYIDFHLPGSKKDYDGRFELIDTQKLKYNSGEIYTSNNKPTPNDIGAFGNMNRVEIGVDLNTLVNSGTYEVNQITSSANHPSGTPYGWGVLNVYNTKGPAKRVLQIYYPHINGTIPYIRMKDGDTWQAWKKVTEGLTPEEIGAVANSSVSQGVDVNTIVQRDNAGDIYARLLRATYKDEATISGAIAYRVNDSTDNYTRYCNNPAAVRKWLSALGKTEKAESAKNADTVNNKTFLWEWGSGNPTHIWGSDNNANVMKVWSPDSLIVGKAKSVDWANILNKPDVAIKSQKAPLWNGATYLSTNMNITPTKPLSECQNGWILVFSDYDPGDGEKNWNWVSFIVPKNAALVNRGNTLFSVPLAETGGWTIKAANITNTQIIGGSSEEISGWNDVVLRQVLEF